MPRRQCGISGFWSDGSSITGRYLAIVVNKADYLAIVVNKA